MSDLARSFDDVAEAYDFGRPRYDDHAIDAIAAAAGGGPRLLDVGAGTGRLSAPLLEQGFDVVAVEPLDEMRAILARNIGPERSLAGSAEALPLPDASVDGAVCSDAWHWFDGARAADELARVVQAWRRRGRVRDVPALARQRRRARLVARPRGGPHGAAQGRPSGSRLRLATTRRASRVIRPSRRSQTREEPSCTTRTARGSSRTGHRCRSWRRCPRVSAPTFLGELDGMLARRGVDEVDIPYRADAVDHSAAASAERRLEIRRQRRADVDRRPGHRVREGQPRRVQELALEAQAPRRPVLGVADDRVIDGPQVRADLVRAPRLQAHAQQRGARQRLLELEVRHRRARVVGVGRHPRAHAPVAPQRRVDRAAARGRAPLDQRQVLARDRPRLQRVAQRAVHGLRARHHEQPRRVAIEAMHDPGARGVVAAGGDRAQRLRERPRAVPARRVHDDARRACRPPAGARRRRAPRRARRARRAPAPPRARRR